MGYDVENGGWHGVINIGTGARNGWRPFIGKGNASPPYHNSVDAAVSDAAFLAIVDAWDDGHTAFAAAIPAGPVRDWYVALPPSLRDRFREVYTRGYVGISL